MTDMSRREPPRNKTLHAVPGQVTLTATAQHRSPQVTHRFAKGTQRRTIQGHSVISKVAQQDRAQVCSLLRNRHVHASPQFLSQGPQLGLPPLPHRLSQYREASLPGFSATMRETQKVKRPRFAVAPVSPVSLRVAAELDDSRFVGMQLQPKPRESFAQFRQKPLCFVTMFKSRNEIISKTNEDHVPAPSLPSPSLDPEVEYIVQIDVRQQWTDTSTLNGSHLTVYSLALFQHASLEPFLDQSHNAPVGYAMLDELHQPSMVESVIKPPDVGIEHPVHFPRSDPDRQRIQRLVRTTPRAESVRESQKVLLIDRVQHLPSGTLDDLIFQRGNAERAKLTRFTHLRDVDPTHRPRSVRSSLEPRGEILEVCLEGLTVVLPRLSVNPCGRAFPNGKVCCPQSLDIIDVVQERGEPLLPIYSCYLTYSLKRAWRASPALRPERVALRRVSLGQPSSLHRLRRQFLGFVRRLPWYYRAVRLPTRVHHRRMSFDFPMRPAALSTPGARGISRFPRKVFPYMHGVLDRAGSWRTSRWRCTRCCLPPTPTASASRSTCRLRGRACISRLDTRPARSSVNALPSSLQTLTHDSRPLWFVTPSTYETFTQYPLPVCRRTGAA